MSSLRGIMKRVSDVWQATTGKPFASWAQKLSRSFDALEDAAGYDTVTSVCQGLTNGSGAEALNTWWKAPFDCEVTEVTARRNGASADQATLVITGDVGGDDNAILAATLDIDGLTADTETDVTLNATAANLQLKKGELVKFAYATDSAGTITDCVVNMKVRKLETGQL